MRKNWNEITETYCKDRNNFYLKHNFLQLVYQFHFYFSFWSGKLMCIHDDGTELQVEPGDAYYFAPGHDGWVVGNEPCVLYEIIESGKDFGPWKHAG